MTNKKQFYPSDILTTGQIAKYCQVDARTVNRWIGQKVLAAHALPITNFHRVKAMDFVRFLREQKMPIPDDFADLCTTKILIVDDDHPMAKSIERILTFQKSDGVKCEIASDGFEAGRLLQKSRPDLVILDVRMPRMDGFQVCKLIKSDPDLSHIKILAISGILHGEEHEKILAAGADDFIEKPFDAEAFQQRVSKLLGLGAVNES